MSKLERLEEYKKKENLDFNMNFRMNRKVKERLDKIAEKKSITTSRILRFLIYDFLDKQTKGAEVNA